MSYITKSIKEFPVLNQLIPFLPEEGCIAGGVFKDIFTGKSMRDIDVWFPNMDAFNRASPKSMQFLFSTDNAVGYKNPDGVIVEFVHRRFGEVSQILNGFDMTVSQFAMYRGSDNNIFVKYSYQFFEDLVARKINFNINMDSKNPVQIFNRVQKYCNYGFTLGVESKKLLFDKIKNSSPDDFAEEDEY